MANDLKLTQPTPAGGIETAMSGLTTAEIMEAVKPSLRRQRSILTRFGPSVLRIFGAVMPLVAAASMVCAVAAAERLGPRWLHGIPALNLTRLWLPCVVVVGFVSRLLFALRKRHRYVYALSEVGFGYCLAWLALKQLAGGGSHWWSTLFGAVYVLIRGFDNEAAGLQEIKARKEALAKISPAEVVQGVLRQLNREQEKMLWAYKRKRARRLDKKA